jgi:hypothetical protein
LRKCFQFRFGSLASRIRDRRILKIYIAGGSKVKIPHGFSRDI